MSTDLQITFDVEQTPDQVFAAVTDVRAWWLGDVEGDTTTLDAVWSYEVPGVHFSRFRTTDLVPGRRVVWHVEESELTFIADQREWDGTTVVFDLAPHGDGTRLTFTHHGLTPQVECFDACRGGWTRYVGGGLRDLIGSLPVTGAAVGA